VIAKRIGDVEVERVRRRVPQMIEQGAANGVGQIVLAAWL
jgi:hypothetical protein